MPSTYTLIKGETLASSAASYTFTAIPSTFKDLTLRISVRTTDANPVDSLNIVFNSDTSTIYSYTRVRGDGSVAYSNRRTALGAVIIESVNATEGGTSTFTNLEVYIPNYTSTVNKPVSSYAAREDNLASGSTYQSAQAHLYRNTTAISSITITSGNAANLFTGSSFYLYGIKNS